MDNNLEEIDYDILGNDYNLELNKIAKENIENYNLLFEIVCQNNSENLTWWISSVASRNPHQTDHFLIIAKLY